MHRKRATRSSEKKNISNKSKPFGLSNDVFRSLQDAAYECGRYAKTHCARSNGAILAKRSFPLIVFV